MQQSFARNLRNAVLRNHERVDVTVTGKNYNVQNYAALGQC